MNKQAQDLNTLFHLEVEATAPCFVIYAPLPSERLRYTCQFIFNHVLRCAFQITHQLSTYQTAAYKLNYSDTALGDAYQILPHGLLSENKINALSLHWVKQEMRPLLFCTPSISQQHLLPFDIFAAVFYCISRYEEWQFVERDEHGRFEAQHSQLHQAGVLQQPIADEWIYTLKKALSQAFPTLVFPTKTFQYISTIDVDNLFAYQHKSLVRTLGGLLKDLLHLRLAAVNERIQVRLNLRPDPFDVYKRLGEWAQNHRYPLLYFFLYSNASKFDRTLTPGHKAYQQVLQSIGTTASIGLHPSYNTFIREGLLKHELDSWIQLSGQKPSMSRQHYLRFDIKTTPTLLSKNGFLADFSMGFASQAGFRAGTAHPFYYYDFSTEQGTTFLLVPFAYMDGSFFIYQKLTADELYAQVLKLAETVKKVEGIFIGVSHERSFSSTIYKDFTSIYKKIGQTLTNQI